MKVKDFLLKFEDIKALHDREVVLHPLLEDYERAVMTPVQIVAGERKYWELFQKFMERVSNTKIKDSDDVLFVTKQVGMFFEDGKTTHLDSWSCKKSDILDKAKDGLSLWNDDGNRIEHYAYDFLSLDEILSMDVFIYDVDELDAACEIINMATFFGIEEESRDKRINDLTDSLKAQVEEINAGTMKTIPADEVFRELEQEILDAAETEEERNKILADREERKKNQNRNSVYMRIAGNINHIQCIQAILEYYRQLILEHKLKL